MTDNNETILVENNDEPNNLSLATYEVVCKNFKGELVNFLLDKLELNVNLYEDVKISKNNNQLKDTKCLYINFKNKFNNQIHKKEINFKLLTEIDKKSLKKKFLKYFYEDGSNLHLINKETTIEEDIFIPSNFIVKIKSGERITILNNAYIISESAWKAIGDNGRITISGKKIILEEVWL